jgi:hypothetical protein
MTNLAPVPSESATCANCSAPLAADQRYCLSCGQPCSPVRLAFLDVLESERQPQLGPGTMSTAPVAFTPYLEPAAGPAWLRRYAPLFAILSVLLLALIVGLLVGHWVTQSKVSSAPQVIKVEGLGGAALAAGTGTTPTSTTSSSTTKSATSAKSEEEKEQAETKAEEKAEEKTPAKAPEAKKVSNTAIEKLTKTHGKAHEKELSEISTAPIEVK